MARRAGSPACGGEDRRDRGRDSGQSRPPERAEARFPTVWGEGFRNFGVWLIGSLYERGISGPWSQALPEFDPVRLCWCLLGFINSFRLYRIR